MSRTCSCTGYLTNPGGVCCMDLGRNRPPVVTVNNTHVAPPLTEERVKELIREVLKEQSA